MEKPVLQTIPSGKEQKDALDPRVLSSWIVRLKAEREPTPPARDSHARLAELMRSPSVAALLDAAQNLAERQQVQAEAALRQILLDLKEMDELWSHVLLKEGIARLTSQYH
ncbi:MAG: hypothetical protein HUU37_06565 [Bdellovibrionales bacterium]|nr:hypothetical protein [Bdellovibrionales bacterium]